MSLIVVKRMCRGKARMSPVILGQNWSISMNSSFLINRYRYVCSYTHILTQEHIYIYIFPNSHL